MGRNNYKNKTARRRHVVEWTVPEMAADYSVLMTNGSGVKRITITGTSVSAWALATRIGLNEDDKMMPGVWWPIEVSLIGENDNTFSVVHSTF